MNINSIEAIVVEPHQIKRCCDQMDTMLSWYGSYNLIGYVRWL